MHIEPRVCENEDCLTLFSPKVHNSIYCSAECRKVVTNKKVLEKYHEKKDKKKNKNRICKTPSCRTVLSSYNEESICGACQVNRLKDRLEGWGWDRAKLDEDWSY